MSLSWQMAIATFFGLFVGIFFGDLCVPFGPWGTAYVMILKVTTIPYLICAIIHGIGKLSSNIAKQILKKGLFFLGAVWLINIAMIYLALFLFPKSQGTPYTNYSPESPAQINFAELLIPENIFYALSNNIIPAIVVFGILVGIAMMHLKEAQPIMTVLESLVDALTRITRWISRITPIGTFLIIAYQAGTVQLSTIQQVSTYIILYIVVLLAVVFWIFPRLVAMFTQISAHRWIKDLIPILLLAYTTNTIIVTLPFMIELIKKEIHEFYNKDGRIHDQIQGVVSIIFNLPWGSLFIAVFIFFVALFYHLPLPLSGQVQLFLTTFLTGLGAAGLGSWLNSLNFLLDSLGLPLDAANLYLTTLPFTAGFQSMVSAIEVASLSLLIVLACHDLILFRWKHLFKRSVVLTAPILVFAFILKAINPFPPISNPGKSICDIDLEAPPHTTLFKPGDPLPSPRSGDVFARILDSKTLRVGYNTDAVPFCFENSNQQLSGYDIAFAYQLATDLGCALELVPMSYGSLDKGLESGLFDIAMSGVSVTEKRLKAVCFSESYIHSRIVFVLSKKAHKKISSLQDLLDNPQIKVAVLHGSSYEALAYKLFPANRIISVENYDDFANYHPNAVLIRGEPQAISWSLRYPLFSIVIPSPPIGQDSLAYPVHAGADRFLCFLNQWLKLKENDGFTQEQYNLWVLGKTENTTTTFTRWSIIHDVLHWTD